MHFIHVDSRSVLSKMEELKIIANNTYASVICITETWLDKSVTDVEVRIPGYNIIRQDRNISGGGVSMYIKSGFAYNYRTDLVNDKSEAIWCDILSPKTKAIVIGCCYRPPMQGDFLDSREECISEISSEMEVLILGDMNICVQKKLGHLYRKYNNIPSMYGMSQIINQTRETSTTATILDHIICNSKDKISQSGVLPIGLSDHYIAYSTRKVVKECIDKHRTIKIRSMKNYSAQILIEKLGSVNWNIVYNSETVDEAWNKFEDLVVNVIELVAPIKEIGVKQRTEPWIDSEKLEGLKERDQLLSEYRKDKDNYEKYSNFCKQEIKYNRKLEKLKQSISQIK